MIDFKEWAREEAERADAIRETVAVGVADCGASAEALMGLFKPRVMVHEERAKFLEKMADEGLRW